MNIIKQYAETVKNLFLEPSYWIGTGIGGILFVPFFTLFNNCNDDIPPYRQLYQLMIKNGAFFSIWPITGPLWVVHTMMKETAKCPFLFTQSFKKSQ